MTAHRSEPARAGHSVRRAGRRWHLVPRTLGWRLAVSVTALIAVSFAITFAAVYRGTGSAVSAEISRDLSATSAISPTQAAHRFCSP